MGGDGWDLEGMEMMGVKRLENPSLERINIVVIGTNSLSNRKTQNTKIDSYSLTSCVIMCFFLPSCKCSYHYDEIMEKIIFT